ncbi:MAG: NAD-dependent epimerase/dehydratase family protein [Candidatus Hodarchaeales archaeon]|jgi:nucleoside-diphosphate-sugar epimerase
MVMKRVLVTGEQGFVGSHLCTALNKKGYEVVVIGKGKQPPEFEIIQKDLSKHDPTDNLTGNFDVVFHLASIIQIDYSIKNPKESICNNVNSTLNILEDIRLNNPKCKFIFASTEKIYGNTKKEIVKEEDVGMPLEPYTCSKLMSEALVEMYNNIYNIKYIIIRSANAFGPKQSPDTFIPSVISRINYGETKIGVGNLQFCRNFVYIEDLIESFILSIDKSDNEIFNIMAFNKKIQDVADEIAYLAKKILNKEIIYVLDNTRVRKNAVETPRFIMDCSKANELLDWEPKYEFSEALKKTFKSYIER